MTNFQRNYDEGGWPEFVPRVEYYTRADACRMAGRAFRRGLFIGAMLVGLGWAGVAFSDTINIGRNTYINGTQTNGTTVSIAPSDVPGQLAIVTLSNAHVNQGSDSGDYSLTFNDVVVGIVFTWDANPLLGSDRITVIPPDGILCEPIDCVATVMEGAQGTVTLFDWRGM